MSSNTDNLTQDVLTKLADDYIKEKKRKRRWNILFRVLFLVLFAFVAFQCFTQEQDDVIEKNLEHTALIDVQGPIFDTAKANADNLARSLRKAFKNEKSKAIILRINSPGGSAVQADYVFNEIMRLRKENPTKKVYAVCTDMCGSAAYYIAAAADSIYANPASMVGSIGVLFDGFGFQNAMEKLGIERRLIVSGENKGFMDPFSPANKVQEERLKKMLDIIHTQFKESVIAGRGKRLTQSPEVFSGLIWTGKQAKEIGLIDDFGSAGYVAREIIKQERMVNYTTKTSYFERIAKQFGLAFSGEIAERVGLHAHPVME